MRIQQDALNVLQRTSQYLKSNVLTEQPAWFKVVSQYPPNKDLIKKVKTDATRQNNQAKYTQKKRSTLYKTKIPPNHYQNKLFKISKLRFIEDDLRQLFYDQHPWELATPKNLIENQYLNNKKLDWSHMQQLYKKLDGDSVVQRALYLAEHNDELSILEAYDQARFEYYRLKMESESELSISQEESIMNGAVFEATTLEKGFQLEQKFLDQWKEEAVTKTLEFEAKMSQSFGKANADGGSENDEMDVDFENQEDLDISKLQSFSDLSKSKTRTD